MKINIKTIHTTVMGLILFVTVSFSAIATADYPIAGTTPWQRPVGAPVIEWVQHDRAWFAKALTGISQPYPRSLYFLDNQGNWYTPFNRPGMPAYDLRGWYQ